MHVGKRFSLKEVLYWTRKDIYALLIISTIPIICYKIFGWGWLSIPWLPIALLGTAVAFIVGFKNNASYDRMWEARKAYGAITNYSRTWGIMVKDFITNKHSLIQLSENELFSEKFRLIKTHLAWLTALRFQLREARSWEAIYKKHNQEYQERWFKVEEHSHKMHHKINEFLTDEEIEILSKKTNKAAQLIAWQSDNLKKLLDKGLIEDFRHMELQKVLVEFYNQQGVCERIKNSPYPRQYATLNLYFIKIFIVLVPLGMIQEFEKMGGNMIWLAIPFSALASWIFTTLEKIGESTESPFEGSANDVPISAISRNIEIDLLEMFDMPNIPKGRVAENNILL
jgi:ion channel-forming bestrophin family protein